MVESHTEKVVWRETLEDGLVKFKELKPMIVEKSNAELTKKNAPVNKYELNEGNIVKTLKIVTSSVSAHKLFYYPIEQKCYNVVDVKKEDGEITSVKMIEHNGTKEVILTKQSEISTLRDYVLVNLKIFDGSNEGVIINVQVRLQSKIEEELAPSVLGVTGKTMSMNKIFYNSKVVEKDSFISSLEDIKDDMTLLSTSGFSQQYKFKRFFKNYEWPYWGYYGTTVDAVCFVPNQTVILCGFTTYATDGPHYEVKYKIYVDDTIVEEED